MVREADPDELDDILAFVAAQQARPERRITYVGTDAVGITAELDGLEPPWATTARVLHEGGQIVGAVVVEWDEELGRAWIVGPWVHGDGAAWQAAAGTLLDAALAQLPPGLTRHEMSGEVVNQRLADLAGSRGWTATEPNQLLLADAEVAAAWPADITATLRTATTSDVGAIAALHDVEFPDTYASAAQLVDGTRLVLVAENDAAGVVGYAAGKVNDDGEGFLDFVVVDPAARGVGVGQQLVVAICRQLIDQSPLDRLALTVQEHRTPARALYERLGFRSDGSLVAYRSWTQ